MAYSIVEYFTGGGVLLTGSSGYVGSLVLEKLLRCTDVEVVYVLLRAKKDEDIQSRLNSMLNKSPVMHLLRGNPVLSKVKAIAGNMLLPGLGISLEDRQVLQRTVQTVVHCAADIRLEVGIQELLRANYEGTRQLLNLARSFSNLQAFVHVSSAYTNMNATPGSLVKEAIYPLSFGDQLVDDHDLVQELLNVPAHNANLRAEGLLSQWNFPNNYTLSKHLAEYMLADYHKHYNMPIAIVRPTLISSVARDPYPGFTGNFAGHVGATLAFMAGLFNTPLASNYKPSNVWDVIPADVTANMILATAAAVGQGVAGRCVVTPTLDGRIMPSGSDSSSMMATAGAYGPTLPRRATAGSKKGGSNRPSIAVSAFVGQGQHAADTAMQPDQGKGEQGTAAEPLLIVHCGSSTIYPLTIMESWNWGVEVYGAWPGLINLVFGTCAGPMLPDQEPSPTRAAFYMYLTSWKIWMAAKALTWFKMERAAKKLSVGWESFKIINQPKTDVNLRFSTCNMRRMAALLDPSEQDEFLLMWKPQLGSRSSANVAGVAPRYALQSAAVVTPADVKDGAAHLASLEEEGVIKAADDVPGSISSSRQTSEHTASGSSSETELPSSDGEYDATAGGASNRPHGAKLSPEAEAEVRRMRAIPIEWRSFHICLGAFLYCTQFKMPEPPAVMPITKPEVSRWLNIKPADQVIRHHFKLYK